MDLTSIPTIKSLLQKHNIHPNKRLGQNFLINKNVLKKLIDSAGVNKSDTIIEVGAGLGTITIELARSAKKVIAVEKDKNLVPILEETTKDYKNIEILQGDILKIENLEIAAPSAVGASLAPLGRDNWKLIGNIPYYITAPLIRKLLEFKNSPESISLMVQKEMAQRICASPSNMSILAVSVQLYAKPEIISYVPRSSFWPMPEVDSAIIRISRINANLKTNTHEFFKIVKAGFSSPRKQLANNLSRTLKIDMEETKKWLESVGIDPKRRAETLTVEEWSKLTKHTTRNI